MSNRIFLVGALSLFCAAPIVAVATPALEENFKASDLEGLGKLIAAYIKARSDNEGLGKAQENLDKEIARHEKRLKKSPLAFPADMGKALWHSYDYEKNQKAKRGKVDLIEVPAYFDPKAKLGYAVWIPVKYEPEKKAYPLILCIPDKGERPADHITEKWVDAQIRENAIIAAVQMPADAKLWLESGGQSKEGGAGNVLSTLRHVSQNYAIDFDRVYLVGRGLGVEAAFTLTTRYLDRFAGVIGRSGDLPKDLPAENLKNQSMFCAGAGANATDLEERMKKLGYESFQRKDDASEADIWSWIQSHPRLTNPAEVILYPANPAPVRSAWLDVEPTDATGTVYIKAKIDKPSNTITVEGEGIKIFYLYFNDELVDLDRPIKLIANGQEVTRSYQRNMSRTLDFIYNARSDPGRVYVCSQRFDLPAKPKAPPAKSGEQK
jgi:pimeloyl-ACP methyl ester carboxylesterase